MNALDELYQATIVAHDRAPRHHGPLAAATHEATVDNPLCGDELTVRVRLVDGAIAEIAFEGRGCALSRAAASMMTDEVLGRALADVHQLAAELERCVNDVPDAAVSGALGPLQALAGVRRFRSRRVCALLPFRALRAALASEA